MKKLLCVAALTWLCVTPRCFAQLSQDQKIADFKSLAALYDKNYGPYDWKKQVFGFDVLNIQPWLDQVAASPSDLAFYDVCVRYIASLHDSHDEFILPAGYEAFIPITADIYDGRVLIDLIDGSLDPSVYTFAVGDELISVDGIGVNTWINVLGPYSVNGSANPVSRNRLAVATMLDRFQGWYPFAANIQPGDTARIAVRSQRTGKTSSFSIPWETFAAPMFFEGPVSNPRGASAQARMANTKPARLFSMRDQALMKQNAWHVSPGIGAQTSRAPRSTSALPERQRARQLSAVHANHVLAGGLSPFDSIFPAFGPPPGFHLRLGLNPADEFLSGTFPAGNQTIGFIRIPSFDPASEANAVQQFQGEIAYFQANTTGLVVDIMNNGGGSGCYENLLAQFLIPNTFQPIRAQIRATEFWVTIYSVAISEAELFGASQETIDDLTDSYEKIVRAYDQKRGNTPPVSWVSPASCFLTGGAQYPPATDENGNNLAYTKPIVVLTNNFTLSAAEFFGATLQDAKRVTVYGTRTDGGGGNVVQFDTAPYSEGSVRLTESIGVRNHNIFSPGFPAAPFIENIGVVPEVQADYQTRDNLLSGGQTFVAGFSNLILKLIRTGHP